MRGRPKGAAKCATCRRKGLECGPNCRDWPGVQPVAQTATPAQLPAPAAASAPLQLTASGATDLSGAEPRPPLAAGPQAPAAAADLAQAHTPSLPPIVAAGATPIEGGGDAASSSRARKARDLDAEAPVWASRYRGQYYDGEQRRWLRQRIAGGDGPVREGEEEEALTFTLARALTLTTDPCP